MSVSHIYLNALTRHLEDGSRYQGANFKNICALSLFPYNLRHIAEWQNLGDHGARNFTVETNGDEKDFTGLFHKSTPWWPTQIEKTHVSHHTLMKIFQNLEAPELHTPLGLAQHQFYYSESHASVNQPCFLRVDGFDDGRVLFQSFKSRKFVHDGHQRLVPHLLDPQERLLFNLDTIVLNPCLMQILQLTGHTMRQAQWQLVTHPPLERT